MGDIVGITTVPDQENIFYKLTSGAIRFQVKGLSTAGIGLASSPFKSCELWIALGRNGRTSVNKNLKEVHVVNSPNTAILNAHEFREFWMQWHDDLIRLGTDYTVNPYLTYEHRTSDLKYITFSAHCEYEHSLQWLFEMPPLREQLRVKSVSNGIPQWMPADAQLPDGALIGGFEKEILYIIRAKHQGSLTPGKFVPLEGLGYISWGGLSHEKNELEVLCGYDCMWISCSNGRVPAGAVEAGYTEVDHELLYVGRALCDGHLIPGKVQPSHKVCYIPYNHRELAMKQYEVLVVPHKNAQFGNPFMTYDYARKMWPNDD